MILKSKCAPQIQIHKGKGEEPHVKLENLKTNKSKDCNIAFISFSLDQSFKPSSHHLYDHSFLIIIMIMDDDNSNIFAQ